MVPDDVSRSAPRHEAAEDALADYLARREAGEPVDIDEYCRAHPELADELRRAHRSLFDLFEGLERLAKSFQADGTPRSGKTSEVEIGPVSALSLQILERLSGRTLGARRYRALEEVGRGGMGSVLRVWDEDLRRALAMKVILEDETSSPLVREQRLARFLEEAQITGQLDHPGIVPVHELGVDESGRVYFTMKLVKGRTLKDVIAEAARGEGGWTVTRLIDVLLRICEAIAFAHAKGVVHRDLKPANVMVGRFGEVYVMDWGLARVSSSRERRDARVRDDSTDTVRTHRRDAADSDPDSPLRTADGHVVGTPSYMSPEQARGDSAAVGPASDVYAIGAILYHVLSGEMPYVAPSETPTHRAVWLRVQSGPPPALQEIAPDVPPELVAICEKAMAREPAERYASAEDLAEDLRAFVEGRVVRAYERGAVAELRKWVRRNRALAAAFAASVLLLVGGLATVSYVQARDNRVIKTERDKALAAEIAAETQAEIARTEATKTKESLDFLQSIFGAVRPERGGRNVTVAEVLDDAAARLEGDGRTPDVQGALHELLGISYHAVGMWEQAADHFQQSLEIREQIDPPNLHEIWRSLDGLGVSFLELRRFDDAEATLREGLAAITEADGPDDPDRWRSMAKLARVLMEREQHDEALELAIEADEALRRILGPDDDFTFESSNTLAAILFTSGRRAEAGRLWADLFERAERVFGAQNGLTLVAATNYTFYLANSGEISAATHVSAGLLERLEHVYGADHSILVTARDVLVRVAIARNAFEEAESTVRSLLELRERTLGPDDGRTLETLGMLGLVLTELGRYEEAEKSLWRVIETRGTLVGERDHIGLTARHDVARLLAKTDRLDEAEEMANDLAELLRNDPRPEELALDFSQPLALVGEIQLQRGHADAAERLLREALERQESVFGPEHPRTLETLTMLGSALAALARTEEARAAWARALEAQERELGTDHPDTRFTREKLASLATPR